MLRWNQQSGRSRLLMLLALSAVIAWGRFNGFKKSFSKPAPPEETLSPDPDGMKRTKFP